MGVEGVGRTKKSNTYIYRRIGKIGFRPWILMETRIDEAVTGILVSDIR